MPTANSSPSPTSSWSFSTTAYLSVLIPLIAIIAVYQLESYDPVPMPTHELTQPPLKAPKGSAQILKSERVEYLWKGQVKGPEDIAFDSETGLIYTSCEDGWVKRVRANDSVVENWVNTGGRPLGIVLGKNKDVVVADAFKGLLKVNEGGHIELLTEEAEGLKLKLTDGADIAEDGLIYFTDASYKYDLHQVMWDILEGRPYGRLLSFDPQTKTTRVLVRDLYFANGVALSPLQDFLVFCETPMRRCRKYYIKGSKTGQIEDFVSLPGLPDNIHYDGNGHFWIGLATGITLYWDTLYKYPVLRKFMGVLMKTVGPIYGARNGGVFVVDLEGNPVAHYSDPQLQLITCGVQIGNHLYIGSLFFSHILRLHLGE